MRGGYPVVWVCGGDPINRIDETGRVPHAPYFTVDEAASQGLREAREAGILSSSGNAESGIAVYALPGGGFAHSDIVMTDGYRTLDVTAQQLVDLVPEGGQLVAWGHTHPNTPTRPESGVGKNNEAIFYPLSQEDKDVTDELRIILGHNVGAYLADGTGDLWFVWLDGAGTWSRVIANNRNLAAPCWVRED